MGHHGNMGGRILSMALQTCDELSTRGIISTYVQVLLPDMWDEILSMQLLFIRFFIQKSVRKQSVLEVKWFVYIVHIIDFDL